MMVLRRISFEDWPDVHDWARHPETCQFQTWGPNTEEDSRQFVTRAVEAWNEQPLWRRVYIAEIDGAVIGSGELKIRSQTHRQGEVQYVVHPEQWGKGYGTQLAYKLLHVGFGELGLHRIMGTSDPRNVASAKVLQKLGMTWEGTLRQVMELRDGWRDSAVYSILEQEWLMGSDV